MAINNHPDPAGARGLLDIKLFSQSFSAGAGAGLGLEQGRQVAQLYAGLENTISVLSDLQSRRSYIYCGGLGAQLGFSPGRSEINSIWEDELLERIHPGDLLRKYRLEFAFFQLMRSVPVGQRLDYSLVTRLRVRDVGGSYHVVAHKLLYLGSTSEGNVWLALCLYSAVPDHPGFEVPQGVIINTRTGKILESELGNFDELLSARELQVLQLIHLGLRSKEISGRLCLSLHTVNRHRQNIFAKLGVNNALEACRIALATGLLV